MSDEGTGAEATTAGADDADGGTESRDEEESGGALSDVQVWRYLSLGAIGLLSMLALLATVRLYTSASTAIARWVSPDFVPVFQAAFNLVVLLLALAGLAVLARRRRG